MKHYYGEQVERNCAFIPLRDPNWWRLKSLAIDYKTSAEGRQPIKLFFIFLFFYHYFIIIIYLNNLDFDACLFCRNKELRREVKERRLKIKQGKFLSFLQSFSLLNYNEDIVWFGFRDVNSYSLELLDSVIKHVFEYDCILYDSEICDYGWFWEKFSKKRNLLLCQAEFCGYFDLNICPWK